MRTYQWVDLDPPMGLVMSLSIPARGLADQGATNEGRVLTASDLGARASELFEKMGANYSKDGN